MDDQMQLGWTDNPRPRGKVYPYRLVRTPKRGSMEVVASSFRTIGIMTHYFDKRTYPHRLVDCPACACNQKMEFHGYFSGYILGNNQKVVVELTERVDGIVMDWWAKHRTLKGARIKFSRMGDSPSSRIHVQFHDQFAENIKPVTEQELREVLCHVWRLPLVAAQLLETHPHRLKEQNCPSNVSEGNDDLRLLG